MKSFQEQGVYGYKLGDSVVITPQYNYAKDFYKGNGVVYLNKKVGVIDRKNNIVIPIKYHKVYILNDSLYKVRNKGEYFWDDIYGVVGKNDRLILPLHFKSINLSKNKLLVSKRKFGKINKGRYGVSYNPTQVYGIYDLNGDVILEPEFSSFKKLGQDTLLVGKDSHYALVKTDGSFITDLKYTAFGEYYFNKAKIRADNLYGFINRKGIEVIAPEFRMVSPFYTNEFTVIRKENGKVGFININGELIFEGDYEILRFPHLNAAAARLNNKWGLIDLQGKILIPFQHTNFIREFEGIIGFKKDSKWAVFDSTGKQLTDYRFDSFTMFHNQNKESPDQSFYKLKSSPFLQSLAFVEDSNQYGIIDSNGKFLIPLNNSKEIVFELLEKIKIK
ncbi:WG repeat-containing protein [Nonlabens sp.]|uniref:WG repeat-containing protein n=1 Tax=Nonlabens sp. TaxID=1888209 RepID=UPI00326681B3